ncbi:MAG TPA: hypothetical protein PLD88_01790, partial [Candidatus Berkiella sp.]|nr:hypothetical protein [Candidatus Berkiella sp.]
MVIKTGEEGAKQGKGTGQEKIEHDGALSTHAHNAVFVDDISALSSGLMDIFIDSNQNFFPAEEISNAFEQAFQNYVQMDQKDFLAEVEDAIEKLALNDKGPDFLNLEFEQLFDIQVEEGGSSTTRTISSGSEGSVTSLERGLNLFLSDNNE